MITERYTKAFDYVMEIEGILSDHPRDPGGLTAWGITKRDWPEMFVNGPPDKDTAKLFYVREGYWKPIFDKIIYEPIALELFEAGVLCGRHTAIKFVQTAFNYLSEYTNPLWPLKVDGVFGPLTLAAINGFCIRGLGKALYKSMNVQQAKRFEQVGANGDFIRGWHQKRLD